MEIFKKSYAKINITLDVLGRRSSGYHDLDMIMQTVNLYDMIYIRQMKASGIKLITNLSWLPTDEHNIAYQAVSLFKKTYNIDDGILIEITKKIPVSAGLAGGSSNAAAVLIGMNELYSMNIPIKELMDLGLQLGADVPYCMLKGTARAQGIGEDLTLLAPIPKCFILLAKPRISVSTKEVFESLDINSTFNRPNTELVLRAIENSDLNGIVQNMDNFLETVTVSEYPIITEIKDMMIKGGALGAIMSGSGPTVFGIYNSKNKAYKIARKLKLESLAQDTFVTTTYKRGEGSRKK